MFLLSTLDDFAHCFGASIIDFEQTNTVWVETNYRKNYYRVVTTTFCFLMSCFFKSCNEILSNVTPHEKSERWRLPFTNDTNHYWLVSLGNGSRYLSLFSCGVTLWRWRRFLCFLHVEYRKIRTKKIPHSGSFNVVWYKWYSNLCQGLHVNINHLYHTTWKLLD